MPVDISRKTFDPHLNYSELVSMQGRVVTDAPLNESEKIVDRRFRAETVDLIGVSGYPAILPFSFRIGLDAGALTIGPGRYYVDGLLAENFGAGEEIFDAILAELRGADAVLFAEQPYRPGFTPLAPEDGRNLIYLDVWRRPVTYLEDPALIDVAVGVDTTARMQTVWQVRRLGGLGPDVTCETPDAEIPEWMAVIRPSDARLTTRSNPASGVTSPCLTPPGSGYIGLENRTYLVSVHDILPDGTRLMKWSRTNGTVATEILTQPANDTVTVGRVAKDDYLRFNPGDWVEITDDVRVLEGLPGTIAKVLTADTATDTIVFTDPLPAGTIPLSGGGPETDADLHPILRRWDQSGIVLDTDGVEIVDLDAPGAEGLIPIPALGTFIALEDGVEIAFALADPTGEMRIGDSWSFVTRYADASVEIRDQAPPDAVHHHYARLAMVESVGGVYLSPTLSDCRDPITDESCCTVVVRPGESIQAAIDSLSPTYGGCVCLKPGVHEIAAPVLIRTPNVSLRGESLGAIVRNTEPGPVIAVGDGANIVTGVHLTGVTLEQTDVSADAPGILILQSVIGGLVEHCALTASLEAGGDVGVVLNDCTSVDVKSCRIGGAPVGVFADAGGEAILVTDTEIAMTEGTGLLGIGIARVTGAVRLEGNTIESFANGIVINNTPLGATRFSNATGSIVDRNTLVLVAGNDGPGLGIDTACHACAIRDNRISMGSGQSGISATGVGVQITGNIVVSALSAAADGGRGIAVGVEASDTAPLVLTVDVVISENTITGAPVGIAGANVGALRITGNAIAASVVDDFVGIDLNHNDNTSVNANRIVQTGVAVATASGQSTQILDNQIETCVGGVLAVEETAIDVADNRIEDCRSGAMLFMRCLARASVRNNRIANVGSAGLGFAVGALMTVGEFQVVGNEILNTGIPRDGEMNPNPIFGVVGLLVMEAQIEGNLITYGEIITEEMRQQQDRSLWLQGLLEVSVIVGDRRVTLLGFAAQITNNKFIGIGHSALVQLTETDVTDLVSLRFDRVFFHHNYCDHHNGSADNNDNATVKLVGFRAVVMGNQVKAFNINHASFDFGGMAGPYIGNVTAAHTVNHADFPTPENAYNMRV